jgi:hypothetical protein
MNFTRISLILAVLSLAALLMRHRSLAAARSELMTLKAGEVAHAGERMAQAGKERSEKSPSGAHTRETPPRPDKERSPSANATPLNNPIGFQKSRASRAMADYLGKNLTLAQLRECVTQSALDPATDRDFRAEAVAAQMGEDGDQRMAWALEACTTTEERAASLARVIGAWATQDINDTGKWLDRQTAGPEKDAAAAAFARKVIQREPPTAIDWALSISDAAVRNATVEEIAASWRKTDPEAAKAYLNSKGLKEPSEKP